MKRLTFVAVFAIAAMLLPGVRRLQAAPLDDRVPRDTILYAGWAGAQGLQPLYDKSNLKSLIEASAIRDFVTQQLPKLIERAAENDPTAPKAIEKLQTGLGIAWNHPTAFYFCPVDFTNPRTPEFRFGLICDAGADAKALADLVKAALDENPPPPDLPVHVVQDGTTVMMTFGKAETAADLRSGGVLSASATYVKAMGHVKQSNTALAVYIDVAKALAMVKDALAKNPDAPAAVKEKVPAVIETLGLNGLMQIASAGGFDGKGWSDRVFVGLNGPRTGILTLLEGAPLSDGVLAMVPKEAAAFAAWKLDLQKLFTEARTVIGKIDPPTLAQFDNVLVEARDQIGVDVEKEIIAPLGDEWVMYRAPLSDEGGLSIALAQKLRDGPTFAKTLDTLEKMFNEKSGAPVRIEKVSAGKMEVSALMFMQYSVAWTVRNGNLYVSSLAGIAGAVAQVEDKSPSIATSEVYKATMAGMPAGVKPTSISYSNPARLYPEMRRLVMGFLPILRAQGFDVPMELLPDPAKVREFLTPGVSITWSDADGAHGMGKAAFPGAELLSGQSAGPAMGVGAVGAAVLLPSLARARDKAQGAVDMADLKGITQGCMIWANDHNDTMPDDLALLVEQGLISPKMLVSRRSGNASLEMTADNLKLMKEDFPKFVEETAKHTDFVYLGKGTKMSSVSAPASTVMAYEKPAPYTRGGLNMAFMDGHVQFIPWSSVGDVFAATNAYRKEIGQPEVDIREMMKKAGVEMQNARADTQLP